MKTLIIYVIALGLMGWAMNGFADQQVVIPASPQQLTTPETPKSVTQPNTTGKTPSLSIDVKSDKSVVPEKGVQVDKQAGTVATQEHWNSGNLSMKLKEFMRGDPVLSASSEKVDALQCGDRVVLFGVVDSQQAKSKIELKVRADSGLPVVENKIMIL